jgi:hypothetical protein
LVGMDYQHVIAHVKAIDRANFHAVHKFASNAGVVNNIRHGISFNRTAVR